MFDFTITMRRFIAPEKRDLRLLWNLECLAWKTIHAIFIIGVYTCTARKPRGLCKEYRCPRPTAFLLFISVHPR